MQDNFVIRRNIFAGIKGMICISLMLSGACHGVMLGQSTWQVPPSAVNLKNPFTDTEAAAAAGKAIFVQLCAVCHGDKGKGDGLAGMTLNPRPSNFTNKAVQAQTDGAIYWKMTEGRLPMASYREVLTEEQRWQLVNYIRKLGRK